MPMERNENGENEWRRCGGKPPHFDRLRWWWVGMEAVEAKCGGCERSLLSRLGWHGGREGSHSIDAEPAADNEQDSPPTAHYHGGTCAEPAADNEQDSPSTVHYHDAISHKKGHFTRQMTRKWPSMALLNIKQRCHVKKDTEIRLYLQERKKGMTQRVAAARAGIGERTARTYERAGALCTPVRTTS